MSREAMKLALEALEWAIEQGGGPNCEHDASVCFCKENTAITALREALAEQPAPVQQEPVAYGMFDTMLGKGNRMMMVRLDKGQDGCTVPLYTSPPAQQEPVAWQLIENAPKDGTKILGWNEEFGARETKMNFYGEGSIGFAAWKSGKGPKESGWDWSEPKNNWGFTWRPTHWMPLLTPFNTSPPAQRKPLPDFSLIFSGIKENT